MKLSIAFVSLLIYSSILTSCKKNDEPGNEKIDQIISTQWRGELKDLGMDIFEGNTPPDVVGKITLTPNLLMKSNISGDPAVNTQFVNYLIRVYDQTSSNDIKISATSYGGQGTEYEESLDAAISGSGNNFSIYGRHIITLGSNSVVVANVYSGTVDGTQITNLKKAFVVVDDSNSGTALLKNGSIRIFFDGNRTSDFQR